MERSHSVHSSVWPIPTAQVERRIALGPKEDPDHVGPAEDLTAQPRAAWLHRCGEGWPPASAIPHEAICSTARRELFGPNTPMSTTTTAMQSQMSE